MLSLTISTACGVRKVYGLPARFKQNLANTPYHLEIAAVNGKPVIAQCDTCGKPICSGERFIKRGGFVWCSTCAAQSH